MAVNGFTNIVTDGLVLSLDAANLKSYPTTGTTWTDLSKNSNNGTLTNGPTFNSGNSGYIVFDGINDYVSLSTSSATSFGTNDFTISCWVYFNTVVGLTDYRTIFSDYNSATASQNFIYGININSGPKFSIYISGSFIYGNTNLTANVWYNLVSSRINGTVSIYVNGILDNTPTINSGNITGVTLPRVGMIPNASQTGRLNGRVGNLSVYKNRGLTSSEVLQNYNATKWRFI